MINLGTNGTYLEGRRVTQVAVTDGAVIRLARSGPNLQIRLSEAALDELNHNPMLTRTSRSGQDASHVTTEITGQTYSENRADLSSESAKLDVPQQVPSVERPGSSY